MPGDHTGFACGGWIDNVLSHITDIFLTILTLPLIVAISSIYAQGRGSPALIIGILSFVGWPSTMRLVRAIFLPLREQEVTGIRAPIRSRAVRGLPSCSHLFAATLRRKSLPKTDVTK